MVYQLDKGCSCILISYLKVCIAIRLGHYSSFSKCPKCRECPKIDWPELICPKLECQKLECTKVECKTIVKCKTAVKPKFKKCNNDYIPRKNAHSVCSHNLERIFIGHKRHKRTMHQFLKYLQSADMYDNFCVEMNSRFLQRNTQTKLRMKRKEINLRNVIIHQFIIAGLYA